MPKSKKITISIVSHKQIQLINKLLNDLKYFLKDIEKIIITINVPEKVVLKKIYNELPIKWIYNNKVKGFGENHNQAFLECYSDYFCVLNPDIRIPKNIFKDLIKLKKKYNLNIISPSIVNVNNVKEINCRKFPSALYVFNRIFKKNYNNFVIQNLKDVSLTDWIGGMFFLISTHDFKKLKGFNTSYFMYFEDVDLCYRAYKANFNVGEANMQFAIHDARRQTRKNIKHLLYFINSFLVFIIKKTFKYRSL